MAPPAAVSRKMRNNLTCFSFFPKAAVREYLLLIAVPCKYVLNLTLKHGVSIDIGLTAVVQYVPVFFTNTYEVYHTAFSSRGSDGDRSAER